jgi:hypothetical protein
MTCGGIEFQSLDIGTNIMMRYGCLNYEVLDER